MKRAGSSAPLRSMVVSVQELRQKVQAPVRQYNDIAGLLIGDRVSIHVTRAFIALGLSPTVGTLSMLVFGVAGSVMAAFGGAWAVAGFACVFLYYIFDCVDGEVARYHKREKLVWGFHDFLFHLFVKSSFFVCVGIHAFGETGRPWIYAFALSALLATLWTKFLYDVTPMLILKYVVFRAPAERDRFVRQLAGDAIVEMTKPEAAAIEPHPFVLGSVLSGVRTAVTNFDLSVLLFLAAAVLDLLVGPFELGPLPPFGCVTALLVFYGIVLPLDFFDRLQSYIRADQFTADARNVLRRAHHFRVER